MQLKELADHSKIFLSSYRTKKEPSKNEDLTEMSSSLTAQRENQLILSSRRQHSVKLSKDWKKLCRKSEILLIVGWAVSHWGFTVSWCGVVWCGVVLDDWDC